MLDVFEAWLPVANVVLLSQALWNSSCLPLQPVCAVQASVHESRMLTKEILELER